MVVLEVIEIINWEFGIIMVLIIYNVGSVVMLDWVICFVDG